MRRPSGVTSAGPANRLLATPTRTPAVPSMTPASTPSSTPPRLRSPSPARNLLRPGSGRGRAGGAVTGFGTPRAPPSRGAQRPKTPLLSAQGARRQAHGGSSSSYGVSRPSRPPGPAASFGSYQSSRPTMSHSNTQYDACWLLQTPVLHTHADTHSCTVLLLQRVWTTTRRGCQLQCHTQTTAAWSASSKLESTPQDHTWWTVDPHSLSCKNITVSFGFKW